MAGCPQTDWSLKRPRERVRSRVKPSYISVTADLWWSASSEGGDKGAIHQQTTAWRDGLLVTGAFRGQYFDFSSPILLFSRSRGETLLRRTTTTTTMMILLYRCILYNYWHFSDVCYIPMTGLHRWSYVWMCACRCGRMTNILQPLQSKSSLASVVGCSMLSDLSFDVACCCRSISHVPQLSLCNYKLNQLSNSAPNKTLLKAIIYFGRTGTSL